MSLTSARPLPHVTPCPSQPAEKVRLWCPFYSWGNEAWSFVQSRESKGQAGAHTPTLQIPESMLSWAVLFYPCQTPAGVLLPYDTDKCHFR